MKFVLLFLIGVVLGACGSTPRAPVAAPPPAPVIAPPSRVDMAASLRDKTVGFVEIEDGEVRPFCTGVWVSDTTLLTARHCFEASVLGGMGFYVTHLDVFPDGPHEVVNAHPHVASVYAIDELHDLALLRVLSAPAPHEFARLRAAPVRQGMFAQTMGHSLGLWWSYSSGDIAAVREADFGEGLMIWLQTTTPISPGNSGGGLFDEDGELVGVCHGNLTHGQALNIFVSGEYIGALMRSVEKLGETL